MGSADAPWYNLAMNERSPKKAPGWLYAIAIVLLLFVLGIALLFRFAPRILFL